MKKLIVDNLPPMRSIPANPFAFFWEAIYGFRFWAVFALVAVFTLSVSKILVPVFFSKMIEYFSSITPEDFSWQRISFFLVQMLVVFLSISILRFVREYVESSLVRNPMRIKLGVFGIDYIAKHSENYMSGQKAGQISQKILGLRRNVSMLHIFITRMVSCLFLIGITFFFIGRISFLFVLITIVVGLISTYFSYKKSFVLKELNKDVVETWDQYVGSKADSIANTLIVKMFGRGEYERNVVLDKFWVAMKSRMREIYAAQNIVKLQRALMAVFEIGGALIALNMWYNGKIGVGDVSLILMLQGEALGNFKRFMDEVNSINQVYGRVASSLTPFLVKHEIVDAVKARELKVSKGAISFENVSFSYDGKKKIFEEFSLNIKPKEKVGIVGSSGSGKSTLVNLLLHLYNIDSGKITIDGKDISKVTQDSVLENVALIPQDTSLFHRTIRQNIAYGKLGVSEDDVVKAAKSAYADEFIRELPMGYETMVGEKGVKLSGGQRQRVAIARAILKDSPILVLDEATSALDNESENMISMSMKSLMKGKTVIAIAHRLSTLKEMDRIIVVDKGKVIETGTPSELLDKGGKFAKLWNLQVK